MSEREPVRLTSLDETFDEAMKELLGGVDVRSATVAAPTGTPTASADAGRVAEALDYLRGTYGLVPLASGAPAAVERTGGLGGFVRRIARRLFVSRTYHATLVTMLADVAERQAALDARLQALAGAQSLANERAARVVFRLWGDYNHLVRVVLDHHVNEVFGAFERHFGAFEEHFHAFERHFDASAAAVREVTEALRKLEQVVHQMEGPHDELVRSVSELLAARAREDVLARRVEVLEDERGKASGPAAP